MSSNWITLYGKIIIENTVTYPTYGYRKVRSKSHFGNRTMKVRYVSELIPAIADDNAIITPDGHYHVNKKKFKSIQEAIKRIPNSEPRERAVTWQHHHNYELKVRPESAIINMNTHTI